MFVEHFAKRSEFFFCHVVEFGRAEGSVSDDVDGCVKVSSVWWEFSLWAIFEYFGEVEVLFGDGGLPVLWGLGEGGDGEC